MGKILLINPVTVPPPPKDVSAIPTGLLWMGSYLKEHGHEVKMVIEHDQKNYKDLIKKHLGNSLFAGLSVMTAQIPSALDISQFIRDNDPSIPIVWGGIHPILLPAQVRQSSLVDITATGEGEETILDLINYFENGTNLKDVDGITYIDKTSKKPVVTKPRRPFDMDKIESIRWEILDKSVLRKLRTNPFGFPVHTGRGCPHRCAFCINTATKTMWRTRSVENVLKDLEEVKAMNVDEIKFRDENFYVNKGKVEKILDGMIEREFNFKWFANIRADYIREGHINMELLKKSRDAGWKHASLGLESGSNRVLKILKKDITIDDSIRAAKAFRKVGDIIPNFSFMIGLPGEKREDMMMTAQLIDKLIKICPNSQFYGPQIFRPYPGCELYQECLKRGWPEPKTLEEWRDRFKQGGFYTSADKLPWVTDPDLAELIATSVPWLKSLGETMKENKSSLFKIFTIFLYISGKVRWRTKFFGLPIEVKIKRFAKNYLR